VALSQACPQCFADFQGLVEQLTSQPVIELLAGLGPLVAEAVIAGPEAKGEPAAAEPVQRRGLPGRLGGSARGES